MSSVGEQFKFTEPAVGYFSHSRKHRYVLTRHGGTRVFLLSNQLLKMGVVECYDSHLASSGFSFPGVVSVTVNHRYF